MRVLMLHNDYAEAGGEYYSVRAEVEALRSLHINVELVNISNGDVIAAGGSRRLALETATSRTARGAVKEAIDRSRPDLVHAQNLFPLMGKGVIDLLREYGLPWVRTLRNYRMRCIAGTCFRNGATCLDCSSAGRGHPGIKHSCYRESKVASTVAVGYAALERRASLSHPPRGYIILSESMRPILTPVIGDIPVFVKPNSVPGEQDLFPVLRSQRNDEFLFVGRFSAEKGLSRLLRDFASTPDLKLALVGEGPLDNEDREVAHSAPNIELAGQLTQGEVLQRMRNALATLVPSAWEEPFGRVAAESLASATPALVAKKGGLQDIVRSLAGGGLVVGDNENWAAAARTIREMRPEDYEGLAAECHDRWLAEYEEHGVGRRLLDIYNAVLRGLPNGK